MRRRVYLAAFLFIQISSIGADLESLSYNSRSRAQGENELKSIIPNDKLTIIRPSIIFGFETFPLFLCLLLDKALLPGYIYY